MSISIAEALFDLEAELRRGGLWSEEPPSAQALASDQPFCVDTLTFPQWLQFVFLARMHALLAAQQPLPENCAIAPMAQEYFRHQAQGSGAVVAALERIDSLLG